MKESLTSNPLEAFKDYVRPAAIRVLENMQRGLMHTSNPCATCKDSLCCAEAFVYLDQDEVASGEYETMTFQGKQVVKKNEHGCLYLISDGKQMRCSIYSRRPKLCKEMDQYSCYLWASVGEL